MPEFMRHDLVWVNTDLPFVVTRQPEINAQILQVSRCLSPDKSALSRVTSHINIQSIIHHEKPLLFSTLLADECCSGINKSNLTLIQKLMQEFTSDKLELRVFGSFSWQYLTQQPFIHSNSDLDLLIYITESRQLNGLLTHLNNLEQLIGRRLDGEIVLAHSYFLAWREWFNSHVDVLVKTNSAVFLINKHELLRQCQL